MLHADVLIEYPLGTTDEQAAELIIGHLPEVLFVHSVVGLYRLVEQVNSSTPLLELIDELVLQILNDVLLEPSFLFFERTSFHQWNGLAVRFL